MLEDEIIKAISDQLYIDTSKISLENKFVDDLGADSLDVIELIMTFEDEYKIEISDEDAEKLIYVKDVIDYIRNKVKE